MRLLVSGALTPAVEVELSTLVDARTMSRISARTIQLDLDGAPSSALRSAAAARCASARLDHCFDDRIRKLSDIVVLAMDMDSTLITTECIDQLAARVGKSAEVSRITEATMRGEIKDFAASLTARVALLEGAPMTILDAVFEENVRLTEGVEELLAAAHRLRIKTVLVSGGFTFFAEKLQTQLSLDYTLANRLEIADERLTGRVTDSIVDGTAKARFVADIAKQHHANPENILVIGDGANDIPMMNIAGTSVAFHAKPIVKSIATCAIDYAGLDVLLDWMDDPQPAQRSGH
jgi:phosphoserine phosphatase